LPPLELAELDPLFPPLEPPELDPLLFPEPELLLFFSCDGMMLLMQSA
jgi:hypothetical protein